MKLSGTERETIVLYNEAEAAASIYTHNAALCRQLSELCGTYPGQVRQTGDNGYGGLSFELPKKWVRITPPRVLTPAQRAVLDRSDEREKARRLIVPAVRLWYNQIRQTNGQKHGGCRT